MFRYGHRLSKDIDLFVPDPQHLGHVTPRLSNTATSLTKDYPEAGLFVIRRCGQAPEVAGHPRRRTGPEQARRHG